MKIQEEICVFDIESETIGSKPDANVDIAKYVGFYDIQRKQWEVLNVQTDHKRIQEFIDYYHYFSGHNIKEFDVPMLERAGFSFRGKLLIDTMTIVNNRMKQMLYIDLAMGDKSLGKLCNRLGLEHQKDEFDYDKLKRDLTVEEYEEMEKYLVGDLLASTDLLQYFYDLFYGFRDLMSQRNVENFSWLMSTLGSTTYKCYCNIMGVEEEYDKEYKGSDKQYKAGYVTQPEIEFIEDNIYLVDFASLFPHCNMLGNLYTPVKYGGWSGHGILPSHLANDEDGIIGCYSRTPGKLEQTIQKLYNERAKLKAEGHTGGKELANKLFMNGLYGATGCALFKNMYSKQAAIDCTSMARRLIKHARSCFTLEGYDCLYTDTDSIFVLDLFNDDNKIRELAKKITEIQIKSANIPITTHNLEVEARVKRMYFMKDDKGEFIKKNYIYVTSEDKIVTKGLMVIKGNCSDFSKMIYEKHINPMILKGENIIFKAEALYNICMNEVKDNVDLLTKRYRTKDFSEYKEPATGIYAQIAKRYNAGEHHLIINTRIGCGKGNKYAKKEELVNKYKEDWWKYIKIGSYINELKPFIQYDERGMIDKLDKRRDR